MFQQFNTDTLGGRFIQSLLAQTPIPVYECAFDEDYIVAGCYYVYKKDIVKCVETGYLNSSYQTPKANITKIICTDVYDPKYFSTYTAHTNYYDTDTHYHLRRYLRYLYSTTGLNLFPFYNCYAGLSFPDVRLTYETVREKDLTRNTVTNKQQINVKRTAKQEYKVIGVPILFGHEYTIALDCPTQFLVRAALYDDSGFIDDTEDSFDLPSTLRTQLQSSGQFHVRSKFKEPFKFRINATENAKDMLYQKMLYLLIQIPLDNTSSIVVLDRFDDRQGVVCDEHSVQENLFYNSSLLRMNWHASFAFSDRLVEYLLGNVIHSNDYNTRNIEKIQQTLKNISATYANRLQDGTAIYGVWDDSIQTEILNLVKSTDNATLLYDQDGFINKDVETILQSKGIGY